jgi:phage shock protein PspC (stress-responsive transcriptional regulator)
MIDGVCGGIAEYFEVDPVLVRVVFVLLFLFGGVALVAYIVGAIIIPRRPLEMEAEPAKAQAPAPPKAAPEPARQQKIPESAAKGSLVIGIILIAIGGLFLVDNFAFFRHFHVWRWFTHNLWDFLIPGILIVVGIALLTRHNGNSEKKA